MILKNTPMQSLLTYGLWTIVDTSVWTSLDFQNWTLFVCIQAQFHVLKIYEGPFNKFSMNIFTTSYKRAPGKSACDLVM